MIDGLPYRTVISGVRRAGAGRPVSSLRDLPGRPATERPAGDRGTGGAALRDWIDRSDPIKAAVAGAVKDVLFDPVTSDAPTPVGRTVLASFDELSAAAADLGAYLLVVHLGDFTASKAIGE